MDDRENPQGYERLEAALRAFYHHPQPDKRFLEKLGGRLARQTRIQADQPGLADRLRSTFRPLGWGLAALLIILVVAWGMRNLVPDDALLPAEGETPPPEVEESLDTPVAILPTHTPEPTPLPPVVEERVLTICMGAEPDTLFPHLGRMLAGENIKEAIFDGPIDNNGYTYQPVILEKLPSLADGDAWIDAVEVQAGDRVINEAGEVVPLIIGESVRPYGCNRPECAITWQGQPLVMAQLSVTFHLLDGLKWSDGELLTARDSLFSYQFALGCQTQWGACGSLGLANTSRQTFEATAGYTALDERILQWTGLPGYLDPNYQTNFFIPLPEHQMNHLSPENFEYADEVRLPMGWGPYVLERWEAGRFIELSRNPHYFRAGEDLPRFDRLIFRFTGQDSPANIADTLSGACDIVEQSAGLDDALTEILSLDAHGQLQAHISTAPAWEKLVFGIQPVSYDNGYQVGLDRPDFFGDVRTRRAFAMCMDRQRLVEEVFQGRSPILHSYLPEDHPLFNPAVERYPFDPAAGLVLLEEVGWIDHDGDPSTPRRARGVANVPDGEPLSVRLWSTSAILRQQTSRILAESLARCGIQVDAELRPAAEFFADSPDGPLYGRHFDLAEFAYLAYHIPACEIYTTREIPRSSPLESDYPRYPRGQQELNVSGYSNPDYDEACTAARAALPGQTEFVTYHMLAQEIFARDLPAVPLFQRIKMTIARPDMCGYWMDPTSSSDTWNIEAYDYGEGCR
jgi:peptide/nickel transport system substrate-binding protein